MAKLVINEKKELGKDPGKVSAGILLNILEDVSMKDYM